MTDSELSAKRNLKTDLCYFVIILLLLLSAVLGYMVLKNSAPQKAVKTEDAENSDLDQVIWLYKHGSHDKIIFETLKKYADQEDVKALSWLAVWYLHRDHEDCGQIFHIGQKLIYADEPFGDYLMGLAYACGFVVQTNYDSAEKHLKLAVEKGVPEATVILSHLVSEKDIKFAESVLKKGIEWGYVPAKSEYAFLLLQNNRFDEAMKILEETDDYTGYNLLARCYLDGKNLPIDVKKAAEYAEKALTAARHDIYIPWYYARIYSPQHTLYEIGLEEYHLNGSTAFAEKCLKLAAENDVREAKFYYALVLPEDESLLRERYLLESADEGYPLAEMVAGLQMKEKKDWEKAENYFLRLLNNGYYHKGAVRELSRIYFDTDNKLVEGMAEYGANLGDTVCLNHFTLLSVLNDDIDIARSTALFVVSGFDGDELGNEFAAKILEENLEDLRKMAADGNCDAMLTLAFYGKKFPKDSEEYKLGIEYFEKAVNMEHDLSCYILGRMYHDGIEFEKDFSKAVHYYLRSLESKYFPALFKLVELYAKEKDFAADEEVVEYCFDFARENLIDISHYLGLIFKNKIADGEETAEKFFAAGAAKGDVECMNELYLMLKESDPSMAERYLYQAMKAGSPRAFLLKAEDEKKKGNAREAYMNYIYSYSLQGGNDNINLLFSLIDCWLNGYGCQVNVAMAVSAAERLFKDGNAEICLILGNIYSDKKYDKFDLKKAEEYYTAGIERGNSACQTALQKIKSEKH